MSIENVDKVVADVAENGATYSINKAGERVAVLLPADEYDSLRETIAILDDDKAMAAIAEAEAEL